MRRSSLVNPSIAASVLALALFVLAPAAAQDRIASEAPVAAGVSVASDPAVRDALARLDVWLDGQRYRFDLPGFAVGVVHDQQLLWSKGYGYADVAQRIPSTDQTLYRIASISKTFAATAVVQLAERGKLSLDDPVNRHLKWFVPRDATPGSPVRVWNLLSHSGGLQREVPGSDWDALVSPDADSIASATKDTPLVLPTRTRLAYSNYGYAVAGQLVTQVSGVPYAEYLRDNVLGPLGLTATDVLDGRATRPGLAVPYGRRTPDGPRTIEQQMPRTDAFDSVGALVSSVSDLAKWASFQFRESDANAGPVLTGASLREMHRPHFLLPDWSQGWGLGWRLTRNDTGARIDHGGSLPGYKSSLLLDPSSRVGVILLMNADDGPRELSAGILKLVVEPIRKAAASPPAVAQASSAKFAGFEGLYRDRSGGQLFVLAVTGGLQLLDPEAADIEAGAAMLRQIGPASFVTESPPRSITQAVASRVQFTLDEAGQAVSFTMDDGAYRYRRVR
jgi:CubicO group peptidase (beta-lactamase class C family)